MRPQPQDIKLKKHIGEVVPRLRYEGPYKKAVDVAEYYGFRLISGPQVSKDDRDCTAESTCPADRVSLLRAYLERGMDGWAQPVLLCYTSKVPYQPILRFQLEAVGSKKSAVEALLIHTTYVILKEHGYDVTLHINSIGGPESVGRFAKELSNYYKEHLDVMDEDTRTAFMSDVFAPLRSKHESCLALKTQAPRAISFLTEASRSHFSEVLECLEAFGIPYEIKDDLVGTQQHTTRTVFEFREKSTATEMSEDKIEQEPSLLGYGERYDQLSKQVRLGRKVPGVGVTIDLNKTHKGETIAQYKQNRSSDPVVYVVQVGHEARRYVLSVTEKLRKANIPIALSFSEEKLAHQMKHAEHLDVPALVIIGQKEISDGTAIIRNRNTRVQRIVSQNHLPSHIKRLCALY